MSYMTELYLFLLEKKVHGFSGNIVFNFEEELNKNVNLQFWVCARTCAHSLPLGIFNTS